MSKGNWKEGSSEYRDVNNILKTMQKKGFEELGTYKKIFENLKRPTNGEDTIGECRVIAVKETRLKGREHRLARLEAKGCSGPDAGIFDFDLEIEEVRIPGSEETTLAVELPTSIVFDLSKPVFRGYAENLGDTLTDEIKSAWHKYTY